MASRALNFKKFIIFNSILAIPVLFFIEPLQMIYQIPQTIIQIEQISFNELYQSQQIIYFCKYQVSQKADFYQIQMKRIKQMLLNKLQSFEYHSQDKNQIYFFINIFLLILNQYRIISTNNIDLSQQHKLWKDKQDILLIIDLAQKKKQNEEQEDEGKNQNEKNKQDNKKKNDEKEENDEEDTEDENEEDSDDDDDKNGGILIPVIEWVKGVFPRVVPNPTSQS